MILKSGLVGTVYRNGRLLLSKARRQDSASIAALTSTIRSSPLREIRSADNAGLSALGQQSGKYTNGNSLSKLPLSCGNRGLFHRFVQTQTTQERAAEGEKPKASAKKMQVLFEEVVDLVEGTAKVTLVDVREPEEVQQTGILPGSINVPLTKLKAALTLSEEEFTAAYKVPKPQKDDQSVIFYGLSSVKSSAAVEIAHKMGYKKSRHYPGGWEEWSQKYQKS